MVEKFKGCTIQSDEQVDTIIDFKEHVDARNWLRNDSAEQVDVINESETLVVDGSDPKSDPSVATHTTIYKKKCTIQSYKRVDTIIDSKEHVDARNWLRNDSAEQVDVINDSEELVVDTSDQSVATHTTNRI